MIEKNMKNKKEVKKTPSYEELTENYSESELEISARGTHNKHITVKTNGWILNFPAKQDLAGTYLRMITPQKYDWVFDTMLIEYIKDKDGEREFEEISFGLDGVDSGTLPKKPPEKLITFMEDMEIVPGGIDKTTLHK